MTKNKKYLVAGLIVATILLAIISIAISYIIGNQNLQNQTGAQSILASCDSSTNVCTVPTGVCTPSKVFVHFCNDIKKDNEKCISDNPVELPISPLTSGKSVNLNDYLNGVSCGTVEMYLELNTSGVNSLGACGSTIKKFTTACTGSGTVTTPVSIPVSSPTSTNNPGTTTGGTTTPTTTTGGSTQLAQPQFTITDKYIPSCNTNGDALLKYSITITNVSTVSGTITKAEEIIDTSLSNNGIIPTNISNLGSYSNNKITWNESSSARTYSASQSKIYTYEIVIPKNKLSLFVNGTVSNATVTYDTSNTLGNTNTFSLFSKHSCAIPTVNTVVTTTLPDTAVSDDFKLLFIGLIFIITAFIFFKFQIGEKFISNRFNLENNKKKNSI